MNINHKNTDEMVCPECGSKHTKLSAYEEEDIQQGRIKCVDCGKDFDWYVHVSISYFTEKIPPDECPKCKGGHRTMTETMSGDMPKQIDCDKCNGTGRVIQCQTKSST